MVIDTGSRKDLTMDVDLLPAVALLEKSRTKLDSLANALLEHETLDEEAAYAAAGDPRTATPGADSYATAARPRTDSVR